MLQLIQFIKQSMRDHILNKKKIFQVLAHTVQIKTVFLRELELIEWDRNRNYQIIFSNSTQSKIMLVQDNTTLITKQ